MGFRLYLIQPSLNDAGGWGERHGRGVLGQQSVSAGNPIGACAEERHSDERERKTNPVQARDPDVQQQGDDDASEKVNWRDRDDLVFHARLGEAAGGRRPPERAAAFGMPFPFFQSMRTMPAV